MNKPINYIGSVGETFSMSYNEKVRTKEREFSYELASSGQFDTNLNFNISNNTPNNRNASSAIAMYKSLQSKVNSHEKFKIYGLDIETIGSVFEGASEFEKKIASITEFALRSYDNQFINGKFDLTNSESVINFSFGITKEQAAELENLRKRIAAGDILSSTEMATVDNILKYSGVNLRKTPKNEYFKKVNGIWTIQSHYTDYSPLDTDRMLIGIDNLRYIGENQGPGTKGYDSIVNILRTSFAKMKEENATLITYNGLNFDIPFAQEFFDSLGIDDLFKDIDHFDMFYVNDSVNRFYMLDNSYKAYKENNISIPNKGLGTNIEQSRIRGINLGTEAHRADADIEASVRALFESNTSVNPMYIDIADNIENISSNTISTNESGNVLYANKSMYIPRKGSTRATIRNGLLDQFIEDNNVAEFYDYSVNRGNYYNINKSGFLPKEILPDEVSELLKEDSKGLYYLNLKNSSNELDREAYIFRESIDDFVEDLQENFSFYKMDNSNIGIKSNKSVSQAEIDRKTSIYTRDNIRRKIEANREPKSSRGYRSLKKEHELYGLIKETVNGYLGEGQGIKPSDIKYLIPQMYSEGAFYFSKVSNNNLKIDIDYINNRLSSNYTINDIKNFMKSYGRIGDEFELNDMIFSYLNEVLNTSTLNLNNIDSNRANSIINTYMTDAYDYVLSDLENSALFKESTNYRLNNDGENPTPQQIKEIERKIRGYDLLATTEADLTKVDILKNTSYSITKANGVDSLSDVLPNNKYTRLDASNVDNLSKSIYNNAVYSVTKDLAINDIDRKNIQKQYLIDLVYDLESRGIVDPGTYKVIESTNDLYSASNFIAGKIHGVVNNARNNIDKDDLMILSNPNINPSNLNPIQRKFHNLKVSDINDIVLNSHEVNGESFSDYIFNSIGGSTELNKDITQLNIASAGNRYVDNIPKAFTVSSKKDFLNNKNLINWFKDLGYTDSNIETLSDVLLGKKESILRNGIAAHFFSENINGIETPMMALSKEGSNVLSYIMRGERPTNASIVMLPKVINPNYEMNLNTPVNPISNNRVLKIGAMEKSIVKKTDVYYKNGKLHLLENDTIDEIFNYFKINRAELIELINNGEFNEASRRINNYSSRKQMDEIGISSKIATYDRNGNLQLMYVPRMSDMELSDKYIANDLIKYLPYMAEYSKDNPRNEKIKGLIDSFYSSLGEFQDDDETIRGLEAMRRNIESNRYYSFQDTTPDVQEWYRKNLHREGGYLEVLEEYLTINGSQSEVDIIRNLLEGEHHSLTKDSHGKNAIISKGLGIKGLTGSHLTGQNRTLSAQILGSIPIMYDEYLAPNVQAIATKSLGIDDLYDVQDFLNSPENVRNAIVRELQGYGVNISPSITTNATVDYLEEMKSSGFNVTTGVTANLKQVNPLAYLEEFDRLEKNKELAQQILNSVNRNHKSSFTIDDFEETFKVFRSSFSTYEQGGMLNPRMAFLYNRPQIFVQEVGKDVYDKIASAYNGGNGKLPSLTKGTFLGESDGKNFIFDDIDSRIVGVEPIGGSTNKKYKIRYVHNDSNLDNTVKLFSAHSEKGIFTIPKVDNRLAPLMQGLYDEFFGMDTFAVSSYEIFKHQGYGGLINSYLTTMFDEYNKFGLGEQFVNMLNDHLPEYNFSVINNPVTGLNTMMYNASPTGGDKHIGDVIQTIKSNISKSDNEADKSVYNKILSMERDGIIRTEFNLAPLEEGFGDKVKFEKRMQQMFNIVGDNDLVDLFGKDSVKASEVIKSLYEDKLLSSPQYKDGKRMLINMKSTLDTLEGKGNAVLRNVNIDDIRLPSSMASYDEIVKSLIFDFTQTTDTNAPVNVIGLDIPGNFKITNPLNKQEKINKLYIPLTRPFQYQNDYMLSSMQKNISSLIIDVQNLNKVIKTGDTNQISKLNDSINKKYSSLIGSFYNEIMDKDGLVNTLMRTYRIDNGGFTLSRKIVAPLLDEEGYFLDINGKNMAIKTNNGMRYYDAIELSEKALESYGIDFNFTGHQIASKTNDYKGFIDKIGKDKISTIKRNERNIKKAEETLRLHKSGVNLLEESEIENLELSLKALRGELSNQYTNLGKSFFEIEGIYGITQRYPLIKDESSMVTKMYLNKTLKGNTVVTSPYTAAKMKLDNDADMVANIVNGTLKDGKIVMPSENDFTNTVFKTIYEAQATRNSDPNNLNSAISISKGYESDLAEGKYIVGGEDYIEAYKKFATKNAGPGAKTILDFDNYFEDEASMQLAYQTISSKANIGYVSNQNYILRELASYVYNEGEEDLRKKNLIVNFTGNMEQKIFNQKHVNVEQQSLLEGNLYRKTLTNLLTSNDEEVINENLASLVNIVNSKGLYDEIDLKNVLDRKITNEGEEVMAAIYDLATNRDVKNIRSNPLFWQRYYSNVEEQIDEVKKAFNLTENNFPSESQLGKLYETLMDLDDIEYLDLDEKIGVNSYITKDGYGNYKVSNLENSYRGYSLLTLENEFGEQYSIIDDNLRNISESLNKQGFKYLDPSKVDNVYDPNNILDRIFSSKDDMIRELAYLNTIQNRGMNKPFIDNKKFKTKLNNTSKELNLDDSAKIKIKKSLLRMDSDSIKRYTDFYNQTYRNQKDIFDEIFLVARTMDKTNAFTEEEIIKSTKTLYNDFVLNLQSDMNNEIMDRAAMISSTKKKFYERVFENHQYTSLDEYIDKYETLAKQESVPFTNKHYSRPIYHKEYFSNLMNTRVDMSIEDLKVLGNKKISINNKVSPISSFTSDELVKFLNMPSVDEKIIASQNSVREFLTNLTLLESKGESLYNNSEYVIGKITETMNDSIKESAEKLKKETTEKTADSLLKKGFNKVSNHKVASAVLALGAIGLVSSITNTSNSKTPPLVEDIPNGDNPNIDGTYGQRRKRMKKERVAPPSDKSVYMQRGNGMTYNISAKNKGNVSNRGFIDSIKHFLSDGGNSKVTLNETQDNTNVNDNWLRDKIENLLN